MDVWRYYAITHADHVVCNPTSPERLDELIALLELPADAVVWEAAPGKGELLVRLVERYGVNATGVDLSPFEIAVARQRATARVPDARIDLIEGDAAQHMPPPASADLTICLGASWIWDGHRGTVRALREITRPGGLVLVGEPYWKREPEPEYLAVEELDAASISTFAGNVDIGREEGLTLLYAMPSSDAEWDGYEFPQLRAAERFAVAHPEDPDVPELVTRARREIDAYIRWGRDTLGWCIYLFRAPG
jgi:SAM-dependent methyltransferase